MADLGEKYKDLLETLEAMHVEPKANTPEEFAAWMQSYLQQQGKQADIKPNVTEPQPKTSIPYVHPPRVNTFQGNDKTVKGENTRVVLRKIEREHIVDNPSLKTNTKNICKKSTKTEDEETEPDLKALIQQINTRLEKIEKGAPIYTGAPENSDAQGFLGAQGYSDTSGYTGAPGFNNPSGYSGARGRQPYRGGYRGNNRGYRGYNRGFQPRYNNQNFNPNTNYNKDTPIICRRCKMPNHIARFCRATHDKDGNLLNRY
ncbi:unnamed protein product [Mytilus coruscus]|uniref:CCHC-type domain-containing protein n=1 Tax=Mytilus coruscus TaxID=42192 RepID=A0A6J7ZZ68_MYTCO|nr:unnamed protein product [Mytilus coruscus]